MTKFSDKQLAFLEAVRTCLGNIKTITREEVLNVCETHRLPHPQWLTGNPDFRASRGVYIVPVTKQPISKKMVVAQPSTPVMSMVSKVSESVHNVSLVPVKAKGYVPFGHFNDVRMIVASKRFYPMFITGLSGNGKTLMVEQVCANEKRECIRANITRQTDEEDLLGSYRLVNGETVWQNGPVVLAMEAGAILLLDEVDLGDEKLMCLQPVLEGKPIYLKKINKLVTPKDGFNIIATANTKGKGSEDGRFIGTNIMNEAFLERFSITLEQEYPPVRTESKILTNILKSFGLENKDFVDKLTQWAEIIRKAFSDGVVFDIISTRRLVHICEAYAIFNQNREKAIQLCLNRFDTETKIAFLDFYKKIDDTIDPIVETKSQESSSEEVAF